MARRVLVCLSSAGATAARWPGKLADVARFDADEAGMAAFDAWLAPSSGTPAVVMVDSVDEDYRFENLPHTSGRDRRDLLDRKIKQAYRGTPFATASVIDPGGKDRSKRREDRVLFCALTTAEPIVPWLRALARRGLPLTGVHTVPTVTPLVAKLLEIKAPNLLVISRHSAGLRQTFLKNGAFRITRLTPLRASGDRTLERSFADEVGNTRMYLDALSITTADDSVQVAILDQDNSLATLREAIQGGRGNMQCQRFSREDITLRLGVSTAAMDASPDALHLRLLGGRVPAENLAPADMVSDYRLYRMRRMLFAASGAAAAAGGLWFAADTYRAGTIDGEARELAGQASRYQRMYQDLTREFPAAPVGANVMQKTVDTALRLRRESRSPEPLLIAASEALDAFPGISLQAIDWRYGKLPELQDAYGAGKRGGAASEQLRQLALLSGELSPFDGDYRSAVATIREFAERLRANPAVAEVRVIKYPLDDSSREVLSGSTGSRTEQKSSARFEVAVQLRDPGGGS
jgi:hypothetical protein